MEIVMDIAGFDVVAVTDDDVVVSYFAQTKSGKAVTRELASIDEVRGQLELLEARKSAEWVSEVLPHGAVSLIYPQSILMYALRKILLRVLTLGSYPKPGRPHNVEFVTMFPGYALAAAFVIITLVYS